MNATSEMDLEAGWSELSERFEQRGYGVRRVTFFSTGGLMVFKRALGAGFNGADVLEGCVFLDPTREGWSARVTQHGGRHWVKAASNLLRLEDAALEALHARCTPPSAGWVER